MKNSFFVLVSVADLVEVVEVIVDVVLVTVVDDVEVVVGMKSNGSSVSLFEGSTKSIGPSLKSSHDELALFELFKFASLYQTICVSF